MIDIYSYSIDKYTLNIYIIMCKCQVGIATMKKEIMNKLNKCKKNGIITSKDVTSFGIHRSVLQELVSSGKYQKVSRGIYQEINSWEDEYYILGERYKAGIYSHATALYLLGYSDRVPMNLHMTFPKGYNCPSLKKEKIKVTRVNKDNYSLGLREVKTVAGNIVKTYDIERCLCDGLRGKGEDIQIVQVAIKKYLASKDSDINKLIKYSRKLHVEPKIRKYLEVLL